MHQIYLRHTWFVDAALALLLLTCGWIAIHRFIGVSLVEGLKNVVRETIELLHGNITISALDALVILVIFILGIPLVVAELTGVLTGVVTQSFGPHRAESAEPLTDMIIIFFLSILGMLASLWIVRSLAPQHKRNVVRRPAAPTKGKNNG